MVEPGVLDLWYLPERVNDRSTKHWPNCRAALGAGCVAEAQLNWLPNFG